MNSQRVFLTLVVAALIAFLFLYSSNLLEKYTQPGFKRERFVENSTKKFETAPKIVLIYTPVFGVFPWPGVKVNKYFTDSDGTLCPTSNCVFTFDKKDLPRSDAVLFHARDVPSVATMEKISRNKNRLKQRWIYYTHENPYHVLHDVSKYNYFFNWTMSYRYESDIFVPYRHYREMTSDEVKKVQHYNHAIGKDKLIAWAVNNCGVIRDKIVAKLLKHIKITVFGKCGRKFHQKNDCNRGSRQCDLLLQSFKFYLSFENGMCVDYITEKYWYNAFEHGMVPIVLGSNYDKRIAIPGSYINVLDFPSLKELADYLHYLDKNDTAYNEYFKWKEKYTFYSRSADCDVCAYLHNDSMPVKVYKNLDLFWGRNTCNRNAEAIKRLLKN